MELDIRNTHRLQLLPHGSFLHAHRGQYIHSRMCTGFSVDKRYQLKKTRGTFITTAQQWHTPLTDSGVSSDSLWRISGRRRTRRPTRYFYLPYRPCFSSSCCCRNVNPPCLILHLAVSS